jgi:tRNA(Ile)-lysidine synthase TilS/MesJ
MMRTVYNRLTLVADLPWFAAFSGGKDSTAVLDLAYRFRQDNHVELTGTPRRTCLK